MTIDRDDIKAMLPLQPAAFHILIVLSAGDRHGYGISQDVEAFTGGAMKLSPGTLYRTIHRMLEDGLISELKTVAGLDPRRRSYRLTPFGWAVAQAETARLAELLRLAEGTGLLGAT